jgi:hypothetical protein
MAVMPSASLPWAVCAGAEQESAPSRQQPGRRRLPSHEVHEGSENHEDHENHESHEAEASSNPTRTGQIAGLSYQQQKISLQLLGWTE